MAHNEQDQYSHQPSMLLRSDRSMDKPSKMFRASEGLLRATTAALAAAAAVLVGVDDETKKVIFMERRAYPKALPALWVATVVAAVAAGYQFVQLCGCLAFAWHGRNPCGCSKPLAWACLLLDQGMAYVTLAASLAAGQGSLVGLTGVRQLQWEKLCNIYTKFCVQAAVGLALGALASIVMAVISTLSAYRLFRLYPSDRRPFSRTL